VTRLGTSAAAYKKAAEAAGPLAPTAQDARNAALVGLERALLREEGLPGRPWFRHQVYAPGFYTGYGVKTLPAVREAIEQRDWALVTTQMEIVAKTLDRYSTALDALTASLRPAS
jgi:N-acetylated-alpha-linked acidic dipeptidase